MILYCYIEVFLVKVKVPILVSSVGGPELIPDSRESVCRTGDSMHGHAPGGGLPPPPTRPTVTHTCIS